MRVFSVLIEKYRSLRFEPYASDFTKYIYTKRMGTMSDLQKKFSQDEISRAKVLNHIKTPNNDFEDKYWMMTKQGVKNIKLFYKKSTLSQKINDFYLKIIGFNGSI